MRTTKTCTHCLVTKDLSEFRYHERKTDDADSWCTSCCNDASAKVIRRYMQITTANADKHRCEWTPEQIDRALAFDGLRTTRSGKVYPRWSEPTTQVALALGRTFASVQNLRARHQREIVEHVMLASSYANTTR